MRMKKSLFTLSFFGMVLAMSCGQNLATEDVSPVVNQDNISIDVCPLSDLTPDKLKIENEESAEYVDYNREVKDFGTKFIVKEFFTTQDTLFNFLKIVYETVDTRLAEYRAKHGLDERAAFFIFKGGNVLRLLANKFMNMLNPEARDLLKETYSDKFTRSDADFGIFLDPNNLKGKDYNETIDEVAKLAYDALGELRTEFVNSPEKYFNFMQRKSKVATDDLNKYLEKLADLEAIEDPENPNWFGAKFAQVQVASESADKSKVCPYRGQYDYRYEFDPENKNNIIGIQLGESTSWIMNTINKTLKWEIESLPGNFVVFYLVRAKAQFEYTYMKDGMLIKKPIGGELIDISIPHRDDFRLQAFLDNQDEWLANYTLTHAETGASFTMKAESMEGLSADIMEIVFKQFPRPWEAAKYEKRIARLFFLAIVDMVANYGTGSAEAKKYLTGIKEKVIEPLKGLYPLSDASVGLAEQTERDAKALAEKVPNMKIAAEVFNNIAELEIKQLMANPKDDDAENFAKFIEEVERHINVMLQLSEMEPRIIDQSDIYNATMDLLL